MQYRINLGRLRDTIQFGSNFNSHIYSKENFNEQLVGTEKKCDNLKQKELQAFKEKNEKSRRFQVYNMMETSILWDA